MVLTIQIIIINILSFIGLFTAIVYLLVIFSRNKKIHKLDPNFKPFISVIIPMWNEGASNGKRLRKTIDSVLSSTYPKSKLDIIIVNDGSTDDSLEIAKSYEKYGVKIISYEKSLGKTKAVNKGLKIAKGELVVGLDADTFIMPDVLDKLVPCFKNKNVMAAIPSIKIWKPKNFLQKIQAQEFLSAVFVRYIQSELGSVPLAPGAFTLLRKEFVDKFGSLDSNTMVEDLEISLRIQSKKFLTENVITANVYTSGVKTLKEFINQRIRWFTGFFIQIKKYKHLFSKSYGNLGVFIMPTALSYIFLSIFMINYTLIRMGVNFFEWFKEFLLVGINFSDWLEWDVDLFFLTFQNWTVLPILLLGIMIFFMLFIKRISQEKQSIFLPFIYFTFTYWFLGSICWVLSIYYYMTKQKIKWGPNYFTQ